MYRSSAKSIEVQRPIPDKLFYKIGEVSRIADIEPYVLRYWETEFPFLKPRKNKSGQRVYVKKDLEFILEIKKLLYQERYTIEGVRKRFGEGSLSNKQIPEPKITETIPPHKIIEHVRQRLREILNSS
ncbi:MAG: MerR family transcriptional regulator [Nitrospirae bacterium]|nr:MAG: MerR family transcriptional regulator [Nitrospirota bacterium]